MVLLLVGYVNINIKVKFIVFSYNALFSHGVCITSIYSSLPLRIPPSLYPSINTYIQQSIHYIELHYLYIHIARTTNV